MLTSPATSILLFFILSRAITSSKWAAAPNADFLTDNKGSFQSRFSSTGNNVDLHSAKTDTISQNYTNLQQLLNGRRLGNFDELNSLLSQVTMNIPDFYEESQKILGASVGLWGSNVKCRNIELNDIIVGYDKGGQTNTELNLSIDLIDLKMDCDLDWSYKWSFMKGSGTGQIYMGESTANSIISFTSQNFSSHPPSSASVSHCSPQIEIVNMEFQGGIQAKIIDIFERLMRNVIEKKIESRVCDELDSLTIALENVLDKVEQRLEVHLVQEEQHVPDKMTNVLQHAENNLNVPEDVTLVDLSVLDSMMKKWIPSSDANKDSTVMSLITRLLGSMATEDQGSSIITVSPDTQPLLFFNDGVIFNMTNNQMIETIITITQIRVKGLNNITSVDALNIVGQYTLENQLFWNDIDIEIDVTIIMKTLSAATSDSVVDLSEKPTEYVEQVTIKTGLEKLDVGVHVFLGIDKTKLLNKEIGMMLLNVKNVVSCLLHTIHTAQVASLKTSVQNIKQPIIEGFTSAGLHHVMNTGMLAAFEMYVGSFMRAVPHFVQSEVKRMVNDKLAITMEQAKESHVCHSWDANDDTTFVNIADLLLPPEDAVTIGGTGKSPYGDLGHKMMTMLRQILLEVDTSNGGTATTINKILEASSKGTVDFSDKELGFKQRLRIGEFKANLELKLSDIKIEHLDSVGAPLDVLQVVGPQLINNSLTLGVNDDKDKKPLKASFNLFISLNDDAGNIRVKNLVTISLDFEALTTIVTLVIKMRESSLLQYPLRDVMNWNCWLATLPSPILDDHGVGMHGSETSLGIQNLAMAVKKLRLSITCIDCTSHGLKQLSERLSKEEESSIDALTRTANAILWYISKVMKGNFGQVKIDRLLASAPVKCPHHPSYNPNAPPLTFTPFEKPKIPKDKFGFMLVMGCVVGAIIIIATIVTFVVRCIVRSRHRRWIATLSTEEVRVLHERQLREDYRRTKLNESTTAMIMSPAIPLVVRIFIPIVILANIGFFLSGHLSLGATVNIGVNIGGEIFVIKNFFEFSMGRSITDMWEAGAKELAVLLALFSGVWPYTKQLVSLFLWFVPTTRVSVSRRESVYLWLDALGKWSFVDIFVLVITVVAFRVQVDNPLQVVLGESLYGVDLMVVPVWGLYANGIAQIISQFSSHVIIYYHRRIVRRFLVENGYEEKEEKTSNEALCHHVFDRTGAKKGQGLVIRRGVVNAIKFLTIVAVLLIIIGCFWPSFNLETFGLVGIAVESGQKLRQANKSHNIFSMVGVLMEQARFVGGVHHFIGMTCLSIVLIATVLLVPLAQLALIVRRWFGSVRSSRARRQSAVIIEALQAWQYVEVYILSILIASWQLGPVSEFMINDYCGALDGLLSSLVYYGVLSESADAQCFRITATVEAGTYVLFTGAILLLVIRHFVATAAKHQEMDDADRTNLDKQVCEGMEEGIAVTGDNVRVIRPMGPKFTDYYRWLLISTANNRVGPVISKNEAGSSGVGTRHFIAEIVSEDL